MRILARLLATGVLLAAAVAPVRAQTPPAWGLDALMHTLAEVHGASARFSETRTMTVLKTPLQSTGTLRYVAPDMLRKTVLTPAPQDFVLQDTGVTLTLDGQTRHFDLQQAPQLAGLVDGVRATLAGDLPALQRVYTIELSGGMTNWQLLLRPRDDNLTRILSWLSIRGDGARITEIDTGGAHGDLTRMSVDETIDHAP